MFFSAQSARLNLISFWSWTWSAVGGHLKSETQNKSVFLFEQDGWKLLRQIRPLTVIRLNFFYLKCWERSESTKLSWSGPSVCNERLQPAGGATRQHLRKNHCRRKHAKFVSHRTIKLLVRLFYFIFSLTVFKFKLLLVVFFFFAVVVVLRIPDSGFIFIKRPNLTNFTLLF